MALLHVIQLSNVHLREIFYQTFGKLECLKLLKLLIELIFLQNFSELLAVYQLRPNLHFIGTGILQEIANTQFLVDGVLNSLARILHIKAFVNIWRDGSSFIFPLVISSVDSLVGLPTILRQGGIKLVGLEVQFLSLFFLLGDLNSVSKYVWRLIGQVVLLAVLGLVS